MRRLDLGQLAVAPCSAAEGTCAWPCSISITDPGDGMIHVYRAVLHWSDVLLLSLPGTEGLMPQAARHFLQRLASIEHELHASQRVLVRNQVAGLLVPGGLAAGAQIAASVLPRLGEIGFGLPPFPIAGGSPSCGGRALEDHPDFLELYPSVADSARGLVGRCLDLAERIARPAGRELMRIVEHG